MASNPYDDRNKYIPPSMQQAISKNIQQTLPPHLQKLQAQGGTMSVQAERAIAQHLQKSLPPHMRQYAGAYMQQEMLSQPAARSGPSVAPTTPTVIPQGGFNRPTQDFFQNQSQNQYQQPQPSYTPQQPIQPDPTNYQQAPAAAPPSAYSGYDFIMNTPDHPPAPTALQLPKGGNGLIIRVGVVSAGLLAVLIIFLIGRSLLAGPGFTPYLTVAQDQQELIHLASNATQGQDLSPDNEIFAATTKLSVASSQSQMISYLQSNKQKLNDEKLNLKVSEKTDADLKASAASGTYDSTFADIMRSRLKSYQADLSNAYDHTDGKKGRALLTEDYNQAQLLLKQLENAQQ